MKKNNFRCPKLKDLIQYLGYLMEDLGSICTCGTQYTKMHTSLWYTKSPLIQNIYESVVGILEANTEIMSFVDRLECLEYWTRHLAKGHMNFDVKLNSLSKELTGKVFNKQPPTCYKLASSIASTQTSLLKENAQG